MTDEERIISCQNEIRRLRNIVRFYDENGDSYLKRYKERLQTYTSESDTNMKKVLQQVLSEMEYVLENVWEYNTGEIKASLIS